LFGRHAPDRRERAARGIDLESGEGTRPPLRRVEELAVRRDVDVGGGGLVLEVRRERADALLLLELAGGGVVDEDVDRGVQLAEHVDELAGRMEPEVARTGLLREARRRARREL